MQTHTHINQAKSLSTTQWCHCTAIIHPRGYSGQHRSVSHWRSIHGVPRRASIFFQRTAEPIRGDGSSWIMHTLTQVLIWKWIPDQYWPVYLKQTKKKKTSSTQPAKVSPDWGVRGNYTVLRKWEGWRGGVTLQSERCTITDRSHSEEGGTILGHVIVFTQSVSHPSLRSRMFALPSGVATGNSSVGHFIRTSSFQAHPGQHMMLRGYRLVCILVTI